MRTTVKKWAFNLVLLSLMASCGGDNNTADVRNSGNNSNTQVSGEYFGTSQGARNENELMSEIAAGNFTQDSSRVYRAFYKEKSFSFSSGSDSFWESFTDSFSFNFCWNGSCNDGMTNISYRELDGDHFNSNVPVDIFSGSLVGLKERLVALVESSSRVYKCGFYYNYGYNFGCADLDEIRQSNISFVLDDRSKIFVVEKDSKQYIIDLSMPLISNPVSILNLNTGERYDFHNAYLR